MSRIFDGGSDSDADLKTDNEYAKNYDNWRKKEEINKLKTKYGDDALDYLDEDSSSSSDDDEEAVELNERIEKEFFKTLSYLKNKDPRIYDEKTKFFEQINDESNDKKLKRKKEKPVTIKDYERQLILEKNGELSDEDGELQDDPRAHSPTYVEEQRKLKDSFKTVLLESDHEDDEEWGGIFKSRLKSEAEKTQEEAEYKKWLSGQKPDIQDKDAETELKPLKDYWSNPNLDDGEKFLRDYLLNKRFLNKEEQDYIPTYEEIVHDSDKDLSEDEENIERQEEFEHKYNFRFEEPDQDFIKRYPRTMENSLRKTDDRRKIKRADLKERKVKEKEQKKLDLKKLQELKKQEIEDKIQKLKEITGNTDLTFKDDDLESDFDPEAHDKRMESLFNEEFYTGPEEEQKPEFPEIDQYLDLENWDRWHADKETTDDQDPHCEDEDFNMDCEFDPSETKNELIENSKGKKKRKRKSLFAKVISEPKPVFDPAEDKTYEQYLDEYYKLDCEDFIGDLPCRFKYRKVVPNSFGLSLDEILKANDRELNKWCSLKKTVQYRPDHVERYDQIAFEKKAQNLALKRRILPSLFEDERDEKEVNVEHANEAGKKKKRKRNSKSVKDESSGTEVKTEKLDSEKPEVGQIEIETETGKKRKGMTVANVDVKEECGGTEAKEVKTETLKPKKKKKKKKNKNNNQLNASDNSKPVQQDVQKNKNKKRKLSESGTNVEINNQPVAKKIKINKNKNKKKKEESGISDARLSAYGLNPKKFKNKMKYGKK